MRGLTQKALAAHLVGRVDYSYIGKIERGEQLPSLKVLQRVAEALNVPLGYFFSDEAWTELLPEEIRRIRPYGAQATLLRETIHLHPDDIPLVREILGILVRHRHGGSRPLRFRPYSPVLRLFGRPVRNFRDLLRSAGESWFRRR